MILRETLSTPQRTASNHYHNSLLLEWPLTFRVEALNSQRDGYGGMRRHLLADAVSATAGPTLVVEAAVRPRNGLAATALRVGIGRRESHEGDCRFGWWLADYILWRQVLDLMHRNSQARVAAMVKNLAILIEVLVVLGELSRLSEVWCGVRLKLLMLVVFKIVMNRLERYLI
jgi:hypothetical protein